MAMTYSLIPGFSFILFSAFFSRFSKYSVAIVAASIFLTIIALFVTAVTGIV